MRAWLDPMLVHNPDIRDEVVSSFSNALLSGVEQDVHTFFEEWPEVFEFVCPSGLVISKMPLGSSFVTDFVLVVNDIYSNDPTPVITLVEIEKPNLRLFSKSGDPTLGLTHAIRQIQDWKRWIGSNRAYFVDELRRALEAEPPLHENHSSTRNHLLRYIVDGIHERYLVVVGRRESLSKSDRLLLGQMNHDLQGIAIVTYDVIINVLIRNSRLRGHRSAWHETGGED